MENNIVIKKIKEVILNSDLIESPIFDIYQENEKIKGYIASETFEDLSASESYRTIWKIINTNLNDSEKIKIDYIYPETLSQKMIRIKDDFEHKKDNIKNNKIWYHFNKVEGVSYWIFIDVKKENDGKFTSFYFILDKSKKIKKNNLIISYSEEVIDFMNLDEYELTETLLKRILEQAEVTIKLYLMNSYQELTKKELFGKENPYLYVYDSFKLEPKNEMDFNFDNEETEILKKVIDSPEFKSFDIMKNQITDFVINLKKNIIYSQISI